MIHRAIVVAALLVGAGLPALGQASPSNSPTLTQVQGLAGGQTPAGQTFDGSAARGAVQTQTAGALTVGGLAVPAPAAAPVPVSSSRPTLTAATVPSPAASATHGKFFSKRSLLFGAGGAGIGALAGLVIGGGPLGAFLGALVGFTIGFALSKILH